MRILQVSVIAILSTTTLAFVPEHRRATAFTPSTSLSFINSNIQEQHRRDSRGLSNNPSLVLLHAAENDNAANAKNASDVSHEQVAIYRDSTGISERASRREESIVNKKNYNYNSNNNVNNNNNGKVLDVVMKFGGSSLADKDRIDHVAHLVQEQIETQNYRPRAIVCSAMGKTTNSLLSAGEFALEGRVCIDALRTLHTNTIQHFQFSENTAKEVNDLLNECQDMLNGVRMIQELSPKSLDQLVSYGERMSVRIMAARLNQIGVPAQAFDAWDVGIHTNSDFGDAKLTPTCEQTIRAAFDRIDPNVVAVVTGFIGHDPKKRITTLGRGGSDLTATALGAALKLDEIQVWKDVDGILTSDPRMVKNAIPVEAVTYEEASELAYFGAQVLHPIAMQPAMKYDVPVRVKNSYNPTAPGTVIRNKKENKTLVTAITFKRGVRLMDIHSTQMLGAYGFLAHVFALFEKHHMSVDVLASSEVSVSLTLDKKQKIDEITDLMQDLSSCATVTLKENRSILTLIADVERSSEVLATVFRIFSMHDIQVQMMSQGASKVNISFIVADEVLEKAVQELHKCFFEDKCSVEKFVREKADSNKINIVGHTNNTVTSDKPVVMA